MFAGATERRDPRLPSRGIPLPRSYRPGPRSWPAGMAAQDHFLFLDHFTARLVALVPAATRAPLGSHCDCNCDCLIESSAGPAPFRRGPAESASELFHRCARITSSVRISARVPLALPSLLSPVALL